MRGKRKEEIFKGRKRRKRKGGEKEIVTERRGRREK